MARNSKALRLIVQIAEEEGLTDCHIERQMPHCRLHATYKGIPMEFVVSATKADAPRCREMLRMNIRHAIKGRGCGRKRPTATVRPDEDAV